MPNKRPTHFYNKITLILRISFFFSLFFTSCASADETQLYNDTVLPTAVPQLVLQPQLIPASDAQVQSPQSPQPYLDQVNFAPDDAKFFDLLTKEFTLNQAELAKIGANGFAVSDRWTWNRFVEAYAWIYWKDLPVLVTTDSLLHTIHQSYDDMLKDLELGLLIPMLRTLLAQSASALLVEQQQNQDPALLPLYEDVKTFVSTAQTLLEGGTTGEYVNDALEAKNWVEVDLFGGKRTVDFTLFKPRGHYAGRPELENYFQAMNWLAQVDFRFLEFDSETNEPILNPAQIASAMIFRSALDKAGQRANWSQFNTVIEALVGRSDNMTLFDLDRFVADAGLSDASSVFAAEPTHLLDLLTKNDYGQQRITGQIIARADSNSSDQPIPRPVSFMLMGQRFTIDSYITGNVVYDRVMKDGQPVLRAMPSPLDVMYALGNDRALTHLQPELATYPYGKNLTTLRQQTDGATPDFWHSSAYNRWLGMIRTLNTPSTAQNFPQSMRTAAWADKMLQTQLASWTQLRHDNILYVKQSFSTMMVTCEYPAGYVEPYPDFYAAMHDYAQSGHAALTALTLASEQMRFVQGRALDYFQRVMEVAQMLQGMAEKELRLEEFNEQETLFLRSIMVAKEVGVMGCGGPTFEEAWNGWYRALFYATDDNPALIADIHTNPTNDPASPLYPPRVLHAATGPIAPIFFIVDTDEGTAIYVGPSFSYFELTTQGDPSTPAPRLNDEEWRSLLQKDTLADSNPDIQVKIVTKEGEVIDQNLSPNAQVNAESLNQLANGDGYPTAPGWTESFRLATDHYPEVLGVPTVLNDQIFTGDNEPLPPAIQPLSPLPAP